MSRRFNRDGCDDGPGGLYEGKDVSRWIVATVNAPEGAVKGRRMRDHFDPLPGVEEWTAASGRSGSANYCGRCSRLGPALQRVSRPGWPRTRPTPVKGHEAARRAIAGRLWAAAVSADDTPARTYLAGRWVWPPDGIGPSLPASVRWLPRGAVRRDVAADWYDVPEHAAGAIVYAFRQPGGATIRAVGLDALDADGRRPDQTPAPASPGFMASIFVTSGLPSTIGASSAILAVWAASSSRGFSFCHSRDRRGR